MQRGMGSKKQSFSKTPSYYPKAQAGGAAQMQSHRLHHMLPACELQDDKYRYIQKGPFSSDDCPILDYFTNPDTSP